MESSKQLLESLLECNVEIVGVITKKQSDLNSDFVNLAGICEKNRIDYHYVSNINEEASISFIREKEPDLIYCFGWSQIISKQIIDIPKKGIIGFHPAELPHNRGRHPIIWALVLGLKRTASTFFYITEGADEGDIISQVLIPIEEEENAGTLYQKIMVAAKQQIKEFTGQFAQDKVIRVPQDHSKANYWRKRTKKDGEIDWRMSTKSICALVNALTKPYIGAHFTFNGREYKVWSAKTAQYDADYLEYGKVLKVYSPNSFVVKTGDGAIQIEECDTIMLKEGDYLL